MPVTKYNEKLTDQQFIALMHTIVEADPWPFSADREELTNLLDSEARERGFSDWVHAYHCF